MKIWRFLGASMLAMFVGLSACSSEPDSAANDLVDGRACVVATRVPEAMRSLQRPLRCGQTLVSNDGRHVTLSAGSVALVGTTGQTTRLGGRTVQKREMVGATPAGGIQIEFQERGAWILADIWGLRDAEVEELVGGLEVVSQQEWQERTR